MFEGVLLTLPIRGRWSFTRILMKQDSADSFESSAFTAWRGRILFSTYLGYAGFYLTRNVFPVCKKTLMDHFHATPHQIAHLWTAYLSAYFLGQFLVSYFGRRTSARWLLLTGLGTSIAVNLVCGATNSYATFLWMMVVNGFAQSMGWPGCIAAVAHWLLPEKRASVLGVWSTNLIVGNMLVKAFAGLFLEFHGWRYAYFGCGMFALVTWALMLCWQRDRPEEVGLEPIQKSSNESSHLDPKWTQSHLSFGDYFRLILHPSVLLIAVGYFSIKLMRYAMDSWLPTFLQLHGLGKAQSAYWSTIYDMAGLLGMVLTGYLLPKTFRGNWPWLCIVLGVAAAAGYQWVIQSGSNAISIALGCGFIGFMIYGADSLLKGLASIEVAGVRNGAAVAALVNGVASIGPILQEEIIGRWINAGAQGVQQAHSLGLGFALVFVFAMTLLLFLNRRERILSSPIPT